MQEMSENELYELASNLLTSPKTLAELSYNEYYSVRSLVASNSSTPIQSVIELMEDYVASTRLNAKRAIAARPDAPVNILIQLVGDDNSVVCDLAASNPVFNAAQLERLASSPKFFVRFGVSKNVSTNCKTLLGLLNDESPEISMTASRRLEKLEDTHFNSGLLEAGLEEYVGLPRKWVLKSLNPKIS